MKPTSVLFWLLSGLLLFCYSVLLLSPAYAVQKRYVRPGGNDNNDGTTITSAYGSITKALEELTVSNANFITDGFEIYIQSGSYSTPNLVFDGLNNLTSIKLIGDSDGTIFSTTGGEIFFQANNSVLINNQTKPLEFQSIIFNCSTQDIMKIQNSCCVTLTQCSLQGSSSNGLSIDPTSKYITIDRSYIQNTATGIYLDQSQNIVIQNCFITNNTIGIHWNNATYCKIMNNFISQNSKYGLKLEEKSYDSVIFNNIIENNAVQICAIFPYYASWQSAANAIIPYAGQGQSFGEYNGTTIYNQKQWQEKTNRDYWTSSLSYPITFASPAFPSPAAPAADSIILGHGIASYSCCSTAPTIDILGTFRPQNYLDMGCIEIPENNQFHHIEISPNATRKDPQDAITISANIKDTANKTTLTLTLDKPLYLFIHSGDNPTDFDNLAKIDDSNNNIIPCTGSGLTGLYQIPANTTLNSPFQFTVKRTTTSNSGIRYCCRLIEWDDWEATGVAYGGRGNNDNTWLLWTKLPDPTKSTVTVTSPILASGLPEHHATIRIEAKDVDGNIIPELSCSDFAVTDTNGNVVFNCLDELSSIPGTYVDDNFYSAEAGLRTLTIKVLGQELDQHPTVDVQAGIYGYITSSQSNAPIAGATVTVMTADLTTLASGTADSTGRYGVLLPTADNSEYIIRISDPAGSYPQKDFTVTIPSDTAVEQNFSLEPIPAHNTLEAHGYPNPAKRGQMITVRYNIPKAGHCNVAVYDLRGREISIIFDGQLPAGQGQFKWPGINKTGKQLAPGTYRLVVKVDNSITTRKIVIVP